MDVTPGKIHDGGGDTGDPIAVVTQDPARAAAYLESAAIGFYAVVREPADIPAGVRFGGVALLDGVQLEPDLRNGLAEACGLASNIP